MTDYQEKLYRFWLKNGFIIRNSFPHTIPISKILYKLKIISQLIESFNMNTFLAWMRFDIRLADKNIYAIVRITNFEIIL